MRFRYARRSFAWSSSVLFRESASAKRFAGRGEKPAAHDKNDGGAVGILLRRKDIEGKRRAVFAAIDYVFLTGEGRLVGGPPAGQRAAAL